MRPKDFWRMHPQEFWWLLEVKQPPTMYGSMTEAEVAELYDYAFGDDAQDFD